MAEDERQAMIHGGGNSGVSISNCSYWTVQGLYVTNSDVNLAPCDYSNIEVQSSDHIDVIRNVVDHTNGYCNAHGIIFYEGNGYNLAEQNEIYDFHRHGILVSESNNNTLALNYANPRSRTDVSGCSGTACQGNGHFGFAVYPGANNLLENNISEGMQTSIPGDSGVGYDNEADYSPGNNHDNHWFGNISLTTNTRGARPHDAIRGSVQQPTTAHERCDYRFRGIPVSAGYDGNYLCSFPALDLQHPVRSRYTDRVRPVARGNWNRWASRRLSVITTGGSSGPAGGGVYSVSAQNSLFENDGLGVTMSSPSTCVGQAISYTSSFDHNAFFNDGTLASVASVTSLIHLASNELTGCVLWVGSSASSLKGAASDGGDIGATDTYQYQNGSLTSTPLWTTNGQFAAAGSCYRGRLEQNSREVAF